MEVAQDTRIETAVHKWYAHHHAVVDIHSVELCSAGKRLASYIGIEFGFGIFVNA